MLHRIDKPEDEAEIMVHLTIFTIGTHEDTAVMTNGCRACV